MLDHATFFILYMPFYYYEFDIEISANGKRIKVLS